MRLLYVIAMTGFGSLGVFLKVIAKKARNENRRMSMPTGVRVFKAASWGYDARVGYTRGSRS